MADSRHASGDIRLSWQPTPKERDIPRGRMPLPLRQATWQTDRCIRPICGPPLRLLPLDATRVERGCRCRRTPFVTAATELDDLRDRASCGPGCMGWPATNVLPTARDGPLPASRLVSQSADFNGHSSRPNFDADPCDARRVGACQREVIELSLRHDLDDAELAMVLGMSWSRTHALSSRAQSQLEDALRILLVTRTGRKSCPSSMSC